MRMRVAMMRVIVAVIVPAMRVVDMIVTMSMVMSVLVPMMMVVMRMILHWSLSAAFRLERRVDQRRLGAERGEQGFDRLVALRADAVGQ